MRCGFRSSFHLSARTGLEPIATPAVGMNCRIQASGRQQRMRPWQPDPETAATARHRDEVERGLVGAAQLPRDVEAESGAMAGSGEERPEQLRRDGIRDAGAAVEDIDLRAMFVA